jgi:hypothetical protein
VFTIRNRIVAIIIIVFDHGVLVVVVVVKLNIVMVTQIVVLKSRYVINRVALGHEHNVMIILAKATATTATTTAAIVAPIAVHRSVGSTSSGVGNVRSGFFK